MTVGARLLQELHTLKHGCCDDCLTTLLGLTVRQHTNLAARSLFQAGKIDRRQRACCRCGREKLVNSSLQGEEGSAKGQLIHTLAAQPNRFPSAHQLAAPVSDVLPNWSEVTRKIVLVSCASMKRSSAAPAQNLYISPRFRASREWAEREGGEWYVLSAKYGLLKPEQRIEPYDQTLQGQPRAVKREWAERVHAQLEEAGLLEPGVGFLWLAGLDYQGDLRQRLPGYPHHYPLAGKRQGEQVSWLQQQNEQAG